MELIRNLVTFFFIDMKNLHDLFSFPTGVANFYKILGRFKFVITAVKRRKLLQNSYLLGLYTRTYFLQNSEQVRC